MDETTIVATVVGVLILLVAVIAILVRKPPPPPPDYLRRIAEACEQCARHLSVIEQDLKVASNASVQTLEAVSQLSDDLEQG